MEDQRSKPEGNMRQFAALICLTFFISAPALADEQVDKLIEKLGSNRFTEREKAAKDLIGIGEPALETLRKAAASTDPELARRARECIPVIEKNMRIASLISALKANDPKVRADAAAGLAEFGPDAHQAFPVLRNALEDLEEEVRDKAAIALICGGLKGIEWLAGGLKSARVCVRIKVVESLGNETLTEWSDFCVSTLSEALKDESWLVRRTALNSLWQFRSERQTIVPALLRVLKDDEVQIRILAAGMVNQLGGSSHLTVPVLIRGLESKDPEVIQKAMEGLASVGPRARCAVPALTSYAKSDKESLQTAALCTLASIGRGSTHATKTLLEMLDDKQYASSWGTILSTLGEIAEDDKAVVPVLVKYLKKDDFRRIAAEAIGKLGVRGADGVPALLEALGDKDEEIRLISARSLGRIGRAASAALPALNECATTDQKNSVRLAAEYAITNIQRW